MIVRRRLSAALHNSDKVEIKGPDYVKFNRQRRVDRLNGGGGGLAGRFPERWPHRLALSRLIGIRIRTRTSTGTPFTSPGAKREPRKALSTA